MPPLPTKRAQRGSARHTSRRSPCDARARVVPALMAALKGRANAAIPAPVIARELSVALLPAIVFTVLMGLTWHALTKPDVVTDVTELEQMGRRRRTSRQPQPARRNRRSTKEEGGLRSRRRRVQRAAERGRAGRSRQPRRRRPPAAPPAAAAAAAACGDAAASLRRLGADAGADGLLDRIRGRRRMPRGVLRHLHVHPLEDLQDAAVVVLPAGGADPRGAGTIVFGLATPTEAAAVGSFGGFVLAAVYSLLNEKPAARGRSSQDVDPAMGADGGVGRLVPAAQVRGAGERTSDVDRLGLDRRDGGVVRLRRAPGAPHRDGAGVRVPHREDVGDGVLAVRRLARSFRRRSRCWAARKSSSTGCCRWG